MIKVVCGPRRPAGTEVTSAADRADSHLLPLRSMVGQLPLEQHIGVRIPEGQPEARARPQITRFSLPFLAPHRALQCNASAYKRIR
jgi:hypothetical protein